MIDYLLKSFLPLLMALPFDVLDNQILSHAHDTLLWAIIPSTVHYLWESVNDVRVEFLTFIISCNEAQDILVSQWAINLKRVSKLRSSVSR